MNEFLARLKQRKLVQWALAYVAAAFALIQVLDVIAQRFGWSDQLEKALILALVVGFFVMLVLAWYHGDRGAQRVGGTELVIIALLLAIGGGALWRFARAPETVVSASPPAAQASAAATPIQLQAVATSAANPAQSIPAKSIAVLPFENLSGDKDNAYFVAGMQDLILTKLADIHDLKVISRTSTAKYASRPDDLKTIGRQLGVATILEGSVQKAGEKVLVNVQLVDTANDSHLWAQTYQRKLDDIFGVEGEIAGQIATALHAKLSPAESANVAAVPTRNEAAYDQFLRAEYEANKGGANYDTTRWRAAIPAYREAVALDPAFALAWARLSFTESILAWFGGAGDNVRQLHLQARHDAERALQLQPGLSAARLAVGYTNYYGRGDYAAALRDFAATLELKPNDADALAAQGYIERRQGRFDEAITSLQQALVLDPRNSGLAYELGLTYMADSRHTDAEQVLLRALAMDPDNRNAKIKYSNAILFSSGDVPRAFAAVQGDDAWVSLQRVYLLTLQRRYREALTLLDAVPDTPDNFTLSDGGGAKPQLEANLYYLLGDMTRARERYAQALPRLRAQLAVQQGIYLAFVWSAIANVEIGLGQTAEGLNAVAKSQAILDNIGDHMYGPRVAWTNAQLYALAHRADLALPLLSRTLASSGLGAYHAPVLLWLEPNWDPIRKVPDFQALLKQYAKYKPVVTYAVAPAASSSVASTASATH